MDRIKEIPIMRVVEHYGLEVDRQNRIHCFLPGHPDRKPSLKITPQKNMWYCFPCNKGGGVIQFVMEKEGWTYLEAAHWLARTFGVYIGDNYRNVRFRNTQKQREDNHQNHSGKPIVHPDIEIMEWIVTVGGLNDKAKQYLYDERKFLPNIIENQTIFSISDGRKLVSNIIDKFGVERGLNSRILKKDKKGNLISALGFNVVVFPYYDTEGNVINLQSRSYVVCKKEFRYKFLSDLPVHLYNLNNISSFSTSQPLYIAEGVPDCLAMLCDGKNAIAIPGVSNFNPEDLEYLRRHRLFMCPDNDRAGSNLYERLVNEYELNIRLVPVPKGFGDYADYYKDTKSNVK